MVCKNLFGVAFALLVRVGYLSASVLQVPQTADSTRRVQDSLEVALLRTTRTYRQIEQVMRTIPVQSPYLNLLPSVLPVNVPLDSFRITSPFGIRRHPIRQQVLFHSGLDVSAPNGMPVKATADGIVHQVGNDPALGFFVRIRHAFGFETTYGHLSAYRVKAGQAVKRSEEIGRVGRTGLATGPHLHYTIKKNGSVVDPFEFCFLLRRRLWIYQSASPTGLGRPASDSTRRFLSNG